MRSMITITKETKSVKTARVRLRPTESYDPSRGQTDVGHRSVLI